MKYFVILIGFVICIMFGFPNANAIESDEIIKCSIVNGINVKNTLEKHDLMVKEFLEIFPNVKYSVKKITESNPSVIPVKHRFYDFVMNAKHSMIVHGVNTVGTSCFESTSYVFEYETKDVHRNFIHYYSEQDNKIDFLNTFAIT